MTDPERLLSRRKPGEESELEFQLLASIRNVAAPPGAKARAWDAIAGLAPTTQVATGLFHTVAGKVVASVVLSGAIATAGGVWLSHRTPSAVATKAALAPRAPASLGVPSKTEGVADTTPSPPSDVPPEPVAAPNPAENPADDDAHESHETRRAKTEDRLGAESTLLTEARARLRRGDAAGALRELHELEQRFPNGVLGQEREVLAIQALAALGDTAAARRRAHAFVTAHPNSPHTPLLAHSMVEP
jgi:hypothetical protein